MKRFSHYFFKNYLIIHLIYLFIAFLIQRRTIQQLSFVKLEIGIILITLILSMAMNIYQSEKGQPVLNAIIAYLFVLPALFIVRNNFGPFIFRSITIFYLVFVILGVIYAIAIFIASKKYKEEVNSLNALLKEANKKASE